jgi:hypothetical protein
VPRILSQQEIVDDWHPLDHKPAPEYIPPHWDGPHAGRRLAEALRTLKSLPLNGIPQGFASSWPEYTIEWTDELARLEGDEEAIKQDQVARNWTKVILTSSEIARMETGIIWPARYLGDLPQLLRTVGAVASARARHQHIEAASRKLRLPGRLTRKWNNQGLDLIAAGLIRDQVPVF